MVLEACSDHDCMFGHAGGMGTNGGCQCRKLMTSWANEDKWRFERNIKAMRDRIAELETMKDGEL